MKKGYTEPEAHKIWWARVEDVANYPDRDFKGDGKCNCGLPACCEGKLELSVLKKRIGEAYKDDSQCNQLESGVREKKNPKEEIVKALESNLDKNIEATNSAFYGSLGKNLASVGIFRDNFNEHSELVLQPLKKAKTAEPKAASSSQSSRSVAKKSSAPKAAPVKVEDDGSMDADAYFEARSEQDKARAKATVALNDLVSNTLDAVNRAGIELNDNMPEDDEQFHGLRATLVARREAALTWCCKGQGDEEKETLAQKFNQLKEKNKKEPPLCKGFCDISSRIGLQSLIATLGEDASNMQEMKQSAQEFTVALSAAEELTKALNQSLKYAVEQIKAYRQRKAAQEKKRKKMSKLKKRARKREESWKQRSRPRMR